jgi:phosphohistidine phosphatase
MKKIYLVRHAKSSWENNNLKDIERPLNKRGEKDAPFMGKLMKEKSIKPDYIVSSPAERAFKTATIFCNEMGIENEQIMVQKDLYDAGRKDILGVIHQFDNNFNSAMLFSHNPGLTDLANYLTSGNVYDVPTCGIVSLNCNIDNWSDLDESNCKLNFFEYPKKYSK